MRFNWMMAAVFALLAGGCATHYTFTPPESAEGKACTAQCESAQTQCHTDANAKADTERNQCQRSSGFEQSRCEFEAQSDYEACLRASKSDATRATCVRRSCSIPACLAVPDYDACDTTYRACYMQCGGKVQTAK